MTDPTKKDDKPRADDKAKAEAVKNALAGTPGKNAAPTAANPSGPGKEPPKPAAPEGAGPSAKTPGPTPSPASGAKPADAGKEPPKPAAASSSDAKVTETPKEPPKPAGAPPNTEPAKKSVIPPSSSAAGKPGEPAKAPPKPETSAGGKEPPKGPGASQGPGTPQGPGGPKGPGVPPSGAPAKAPEPRKPAAKPHKKRGCLGTLIWLAVIIVAIAVGAYYSWPYWPDAVKKPVEAKIAEMVPEVQTPEEKAALEDRLAKYDQQLAALESKVAESGNRKTLTEADVKALVEASGGADDDDAQVSALATRIEALEKALSNMGSSEKADAGATAAVGASVHALSQRVAELEADSSSVAAMKDRLSELEARAQAAPSGETKAAAVLAVSQLSDAVMRSGPFTTELDALKAVAGDDAAMTKPIGVLEPQAASGVPSLIDLRAAFPAVADDVSRVQAEWTGEDWVDKALSRVTSLVSVRKTGADAVAAEGADGALAKAEVALNQGDVAAAVKALEGLEGPPAKAAAPWLAEARKRLTAEAALVELRQQAINLLATGG